MSKQRNVDFKALIAGAVPAGPEPAEPAQLAETDRPVSGSRGNEVVTLKPLRAAPVAGKGTLKERAHQLSVYLETPVYNALREVAHAEHAKLHALVLEGIDLVLRKRGQPSIRQLMKASGA
jgi:hypothetical protein